MSGFDISMYRDMFVEEAEELFESADNVLLEAENNGSLTEDEMGQLFRDVHTLKGSGASVELAFFAEFTHDVENMMDKLRNHKLEYIPEMAGVLIDGLDVMKEILQLECDGEITREIFSEKTDDLLKTIRGYMDGEGSSATQEEAESIPATSTQEASPVAVAETSTQEEVSSSAKTSGNGAWGFFNEEQLEEVEEMESSSSNFGFFDDMEAIEPNATISMDPAPVEKTAPVETPVAEKVETKASEVKAPETKPEPVKKAPAKKSGGAAPAKKTVTSTIRVNLDKIDLLMNNVGDLVITNAMLTQYSTTIDNNKVRNSVLERLELLERHIREMQDSIMSIRMVPMESIYSKFPKVVRDISKKLGKKIEFKHEGDSVEIDKAMIEGLTDPLMHIIRNSLDHGLEMPDERAAAGKSETGTITITAEQANGQMIITINDDGKGIDADRVAQKSFDNGIIDEYQLSTMTNNEKAMLIFGAGVSTADTITDISGRGVGMDVVKTNITKLGGIIKLDTEVGVGTTITIMLPLTLAILDGLDIAVGDLIYILPLSSIVESLQPSTDMIKKIGDGTQDLLMLREEFIPVVRLHNLFDIKPKHEKIEEGMLIVVKSGTLKIAMFIDEFLHQHQVVVKPLDKNFRSVEGIGAATVRGDGSIGLILDVMGIIEAQKKSEQFHMNANENSNSNSNSKLEAS
ncbi:MAG: chemotaxis protein CheA [Campylobacterota bacterium]|nr:chemotaxis protein CheA [Campylobacterota bacterium]